MRQTRRLGAKFIAVLAAIISLILLIGFVSGVPAGPSVSYIDNYTSSNTNPATVNNASHTGGVIAVMNLNNTQQTTHWKAYVGNVTGKLALQDSDNYSIYEWEFATITGEVYATRSSSVTWSGVTCANSTHVADEMTEMNHTATFVSIDNISATFNYTESHAAFLAGATNISANSCNFSTETYVGSAAQSGTFEEVLLYDGSLNLIYTTILESNQGSYHTGWSFDYQMLVAEKGEPSFTGVTTYYFYVELG